MVAVALPNLAFERLPVFSLDEGIAGLLAESAGLLAGNEQLRCENRRLGSEVEHLTGRVAELEGLVEELRRAAKRQAVPFSRGKAWQAGEKAWG